MKSALIACGIFLFGLALIGVITDADFVPAGVQKVLGEVANIF